MRAVLSISIPPHKLAKLKKRAELQNMTVSAYVIGKIEEDDYEEVITEEDVLIYAKEAKKDFLVGNVKKLSSPQDLLLPELP